MVASDNPEIKQLEEKATETTLADIEKYDPALFAEIKKTSGEKVDADLLQTVTVKKAFEAAPNKKSNKPSLKAIQSDLDSMNEDQIYKKYFKVD